MMCSMPDLNFPTKDRTHTPCIRSLESQPLVSWKSKLLLIKSNSCEPKDCSQPGSYIHYPGIILARILECLAISFSSYVEYEMVNVRLFVEKKNPKNV